MVSFVIDVSEEIVRKINLILEGLPGGAKVEWSEQLRGKKGTKSAPMT